MKINKYIRQHKWIAIVFAVLIVIIAAQFLYPRDRLLPFSSVDSLSTSSWRMKDATWELDKALNDQAISIRFNDSKEDYATTKPAVIGLKVSNQQRVEALGYPFYMRLIPSSIAWYGLFQTEGQPGYERNEQDVRSYLTKSIGKSCSFPAKNATLDYKDKKLAVVPAKTGGTCKEEKATQALLQIKPRLGVRSVARFDVRTISAEVSTAEAEKTLQTIKENSVNGVTIVAGKTKKTIPQADIFPLIDAKPSGDKLAVGLDSKKASKYLNKTVASLVSKPAGSTKIKTKDFTVVDKKVGATGQKLDTGRTTKSVTSVLNGRSKQANAVIAKVPPKELYTRTYTKTSVGISAMLQHYSDDHPGTFGVSFSELSGRGLSANYNSNQSFITASTYKLFVAYGTLKKVEANKWKWSDEIAGGRNLSTCFDDMIVKSDNPCAEALYEKIGYQKVIDDVRKLGLSSTVLASDGQRTTAGDLTKFLARLQTKSLGLKSSSYDRLLSAMKRNVYRSGIPSGTSGTVADKVGFLNGLLHDTAIVSTSKGTYVLTIMSDGSSWSAVADITRKIEALR